MPECQLNMKRNCPRLRIRWTGINLFLQPDQNTDFDGLVIPESIVEAFIQKIWVSKDEFRWYLRTNRSSSAEDAEHIQIGAFTLTLEDAKSYQYSFSTRKRIYNWEDLNVTVWI